MVDPPERVLRAVFAAAQKDKGPIPVRGTVNGAEFVQTLVKYSGAWRLYINGIMLKDSGTSVGDTVSISMEFDPRTREVPMPKQLAAALKKDQEANAVFKTLSPSRKKEILRYIGSLRSEEAVKRNVEHVILQLGKDTTELEDRLFGRIIKKSGR